MKGRVISNMQNKRVEWLDVARGIAIILVVVGHSVPTALREGSIIAQYLYDFIYFFHMQLWFLLSGISYRLNNNKYKNMESKKFLLNKIKTLFIPYVFYAVLIFSIFYIGNYLPVLKDILQKVGLGKISISNGIIGLLIGDNLYSIHLWFIYVLFAYNIITFLLKKLSPRIYNIISMAFVIALLLWYILHEYNDNLLALNNLVFLYFWFILGVNFDFEKIKKGYGNFILFGAWVIGYIGYYIQGWEETVPLFFGTVIYKTIGVILIIGISKTISCKLKNYLTYIGQNSFTIYLLHQPFFATGFATLLCTMISINVGIIVILTSIMSIIIPLFIASLIKKTKRLRYLLGLYR